MRVTANDFCPSVGPTLNVERAPREQAPIDHRLRAYYDDLLRQPVPDRLLHVIENLAAANAPAQQLETPQSVATGFLFDSHNESAMACAD
jgi:hypothetical protein